MKKWMVWIVWAAGVLGVIAGWFHILVRERREIDYRDARIDKFKRYFDLTNEWLCLKNQGRKLDEYFIKKGWSHIAIYGMGELGKRLIEELKDSGIIVEYAIDQYADKVFPGVEIKALDEELPIVDAIIVTPIFAYDYLEEKIMDLVDYSIVSIEDVVFAREY